MKFKNIAIIPARGGSKRIKNKNIKDFLGKPIISYSIEVALKSKLFDKIIVSTDSDEIAKISKEFGAEVPFVRPKELADDYTGIHEVIKHAVNSLEKKIQKIDFICCIFPTAPLTQISDIKKGYEIIKSNKWNSVISATNFSYPIFRSFKKNSHKGLDMIFPEHYHTRSQDLPKVFHDAGMFYWAKPSVCKKNIKGYNSTNTIVEIPNKRVQDIDTLDDWERAEMIYKLIN